MDFLQVAFFSPYVDSILGDFRFDQEKEKQK